VAFDPSEASQDVTELLLSVVEVRDEQVEGDTFG